MAPLHIPSPGTSAEAQSAISTSDASYHLIMTIVNPTISTVYTRNYARETPPPTPPSITTLGTNSPRVTATTAVFRPSFKEARPQGTDGLIEPQSFFDIVRRTSRITFDYSRKTSTRNNDTILSSQERHHKPALEKGLLILIVLASVLALCLFCSCFRCFFKCSKRSRQRGAIIKTSRPFGGRDSGSVRHIGGGVPSAGMRLARMDGIDDGSSITYVGSPSIASTPGYGESTDARAMNTDEVSANKASQLKQKFWSRVFKSSPLGKQPASRKSSTYTACPLRMTNAFTPIITKCEPNIQTGDLVPNGLGAIALDGRLESDNHTRTPDAIARCVTSFNGTSRNKEEETKHLAGELDSDEKTIGAGDIVSSSSPAENSDVDISDTKVTT